MSLTTSELSRIEDQHDTNYIELKRIVEEEGLTNVLDMLTEIAEEKATHYGQEKAYDHNAMDRWEKITEFLKQAAVNVEHKT